MGCVTMLEAVRQFADPRVAHDYFVALRWPGGVACPIGCGSLNVKYYPKHQRWYCRDCRAQFTAKVGTIFEDSPISFSKWLPAVWLISSARNGISSCELARALGVTQKTAWFMLHRIRESLDERAHDRPFEGPVEADETYIGGLAQNMNARRKARYERSWSGRGKTPVMGILQRRRDDCPSQVRAWVIPFVEGPLLKKKITDNVVEGAEVHTDGATTYKGLARSYRHEIVDHHAFEYVRGHVHTNSIESFFSVFKRTIKGTYICPRAKHLQRYVQEQVFRFNERENTDGPRFIEAAKLADGKRLTYKSLIQKRS